MSVLIEQGKRLVHAGLCPACEARGERIELQRHMPEGFHYHGRTEDADPPFLYCAVDGQGYRVATTPDGSTDLRILPPCTGGLHADGTVGYR